LLASNAADISANTTDISANAKVAYSITTYSDPYAYSITTYSYAANTTYSYAANTTSVSELVRNG
jgi:hypothetical protein